MDYPDELSTQRSSGKWDISSDVTVVRDDDNRSLADPATNIRVVVRVRPLLSHEKHSGGNECVECTSSDGVRVSEPSGPGKQYQFDKVYGPVSSQVDVFTTSGIQALIAFALEGYASTIMAYGQTGSGKTYTVSGLDERITSGGFVSPDTDGLLPRCLARIFDDINARQPRQYKVKASYLEIYNERVIDLLNIDESNARSLHIRLHPDSGFFVENQVVVECTSTEDLLAVAAEGHRNRHVGSHSLNHDSSRSHSIMTVYLEAEDKPGSGHIRYGKLSFVDLAGSENLKNSKSAGTMLKETGQINKSLFVLGKVISALGDIHSGRKARSHHVPYRDSVLTKLLMDSLGGHGLSMIIACCSPAPEHVEETLRTLNYALRAKNIKNKPTKYTDLGDKTTSELKRIIRILKEDNANLRQLLANANIPVPAPPPHTSETQQSLGSSNNLSADSLTDTISNRTGESRGSLYSKSISSPHPPSSPLNPGDDDVVLENVRLRRKIHHLEKVFVNQNDVDFWDSSTKSNRASASGSRQVEYEIQDLKAELMAMREKAKELQMRNQLLEAGQKAEKDLLYYHAKSNVKKETHDNFQLKQANRALEKQIESFKMREYSLLQQHSDILNFLSERGHEQYASSLRDKLRTIQTNFDPLSRTPSKLQRTTSPYPGVQPLFLPSATTPTSFGAAGNRGSFSAGSPSNAQNFAATGPLPSPTGTPPLLDAPKARETRANSTPPRAGRAYSTLSGGSNPSRGTLTLTQAPDETSSIKIHSSAAAALLLD